MGTLGQKGKVRGLSGYNIRKGRTSQKKGGMCSGLNDVRNDLNNHGFSGLGVSFTFRDKERIAYIYRLTFIDAYRIYIGAQCCGYFLVNIVIPEKDYLIVLCKAIVLASQGTESRVPILVKVDKPSLILLREVTVGHLYHSVRGF